VIFWDEDPQPEVVEVPEEQAEEEADLQNTSGTRN
jgi:hypothetical protein